jgi:hypothetical protein
MGLAGCSGLTALYLPAHSNSRDVVGENVSLKTLYPAEMLQYSNEWQSVFGQSLLQPTPSGSNAPQFAAALAAPLAAAATGFLVGYVTNGLNREASLYTAQFGKTRAFDSFWEITTSETGTNQNLHYYGFELTRHTKAHNGTDPLKQKDAPAFTLVCGMRPSSDGRLIEIAPLLYERTSSKAKVLNIQWWSFLLPPFIHPLFLLPNQGTRVKTSVDIEVDAVWITGNEVANLSKVAAFTIDLPDFDLDAKIDVIRASGDNTLGESSGWIAGIPISNITLPAVGTKYAGTFTLKATVTEKDPSNAQQDLQKLGTLVGGQEQKVIAIVTNAVQSAAGGK